MTDSEFLERIKHFSLDELYQIREGIDGDKYPQRLIEVDKNIALHPMQGSNKKGTRKFQNSKLISVIVIIILFLLWVPNKSQGYISFVMGNGSKLFCAILISTAIWIAILATIRIAIKARYSSLGILSLIIFPAICFMMVETLPYGYTKYYGDEKYLDGMVIGAYRSNEKGCRQFAEIKIPRYPAFEKYCLSENEWENIKAYRKAQFTTELSAYGILIENIRQNTFDLDENSLKIDSTGFNKIDTQIQKSANK